MSNRDIKVGINILRPQSVELNLLFILVAEYMPSLTTPIKPRPASTGPSISLIYRQIRFVFYRLFYIVATVTWRVE